MRLTESMISAIAAGITAANATKPAYKAEVLDASGKSVGWVSYHYSVIKSRSAAMRLTTDDMSTWLRQIAYALPKGAHLVIRKVRKAGVTA